MEKSGSVFNFRYISSTFDRAQGVLRRNVRLDLMLGSKKEAADGDLPAHFLPAEMCDKLGEYPLQGGAVQRVVLDLCMFT